MLRQEGEPESLGRLQQLKVYAITCFDFTSQTCIRKQQKTKGMSEMISANTDIAGPGGQDGEVPSAH